MAKPSFLQSADYFRRAATKGWWDLIKSLPPVPSEADIYFPEESIFSDPQKLPNIKAQAIARAEKLLGGNIVPEEAIPGYTLGAAKPWIDTAAESYAMPGGRLTNILSSEGGEVAHQIAPDNPLAPFLGAAATALTAEGAVTLLKKSRVIGSLLNRLSFSPTAAKVKQSIFTRGLPNPGEEASDFSQSLEQLARDVEPRLGTNRSPTKILEVSDNIVDELGAGVDGTIADLDAARSAKLGGNARSGWANTTEGYADATKNLKPAWARTQNYINSVDSPKMQELLQEELGRIDADLMAKGGSINAMQRYKKYIFRDPAWRSLNPDLRDRLIKYIGLDLKDSVYDAALMNGGEEIATKIETGNAAMHPHLAARSHLYDLISKAETWDPAKVLALLKNTTTRAGSIIAPAIAAATMGHSPGAALITGGVAAGMNLLATPRGEALMAKGFNTLADVAESPVGRRLLSAAGPTSNESLFAGAVGGPVASSNPPPAELQEQQRIANVPVLAPNEYEQMYIDQGGALGGSNSNIAPAQVQAPGPLKQNEYENLVFGDSADLKKKVMALASMELKYPEKVSRLLPKMKSIESGGDPNAISPVGAQGLYQIMPDTWNEWAPKVGVDVKKPFDPAGNEKVAQAYLDHLLDHYGGHEPYAVAAYNWGMGSADKPRVDYLAKALGPDVPWDRLHRYVPPETQNYLAKVFGETENG